MPNYEVKSNDDLFNRWQTMGYEVQRLGEIVQNDIVINGHALNDWENFVSKKIEEIRDLFSDTDNHIISRPITDIDPNTLSIWIVLAFTDFIVMRIRIREPLIQAEAELVGRKSCAEHGFQFHGIYSEDDIERAEAEMDIPF